MDPVTLAAAKAGSRRLVNERQEHYGEARGYHHVSLGTITAADATNAVGGSLLFPLCAVAGMTLVVTEFHLMPFTLVSGSATDYWTFTLIRSKQTGPQPPPSPSSGPTVTADIVINETRTPQGHGMVARAPWWFNHRSWNRANAILGANDHLLLRVAATGSPTTLDRLMATWGYVEVLS